MRKHYYNVLHYMVLEMFLNVFMVFVKASSD